MKNYKIKAFRVERGLSQSEMAETLGMSYSMYQKKERGEYNWTNEEQLKFVQAHRLTLKQFSDFFYGSQLPIGHWQNNN